MKIVITGATGFVGGAMMRYFSNAGHQIIGIGRNKSLESHLSSYGEFRALDLNDSFEEIECDVCIHSAGLASDQASYKDLYSVNLDGTKNIFNRIRSKKFIHISSSSVYNFDQHSQQENDSIDIDRLEDYGKTKRLAELFLEDNQSDTRSISVLRPRAIYGIGDRLLFPRVISKVQNNRIVLPGDLKVQTSLTHIDNLIEATELCIHSESTFDLFNVADSRTYEMRACISNILNAYYDVNISMKAFPLSLAKFIAKYLEILKVPSSLNTMSINNLSKNMVLNTHHIRETLDYQGSHNFQNSIQSIIAWFKTFDVQTLKNSTSDLSWTNLPPNA